MPNDFLDAELGSGSPHDEDSFGPGRKISINHSCNL